MPGPAPKHPDQRRRRNAAPSMTRLPAEGRTGDPPVWPLGRQAVAEKRIWLEVWATPQAVAWERLGWTRTVARYVRLAAVAERPKAPASICAEVRQLEDRLGLTPMSLLRLRWEIIEDELADARDERRPEPRRLRAVDPGAVAGA